MELARVENFIDMKLILHRLLNLDNIKSAEPDSESFNTLHHNFYRSVDVYDVDTDIFATTELPSVRTVLGEVKAIKMTYDPNEQKAIISFSLLKL